MSVYGNQVKYSQNYGKSWNAGTGVDGSFVPTLNTIACSSTGGYIFVGGNVGKHYTTYDTPTDVRAVVGVTGISISNDGMVSYTINNSVNNSLYTKYGQLKLSIG